MYLFVLQKVKNLTYDFCPQRMLHPTTTITTTTTTAKIIMWVIMTNQVAERLGWECRQS